MPKAAAFAVIVLVLAAAARSQTVAVLAPDGAEGSLATAALLEDSLAERLRLRDASLASAAFDATVSETPFNLTNEQARNIGAAIGCDFFILVRASTLRRSSSARSEYFEAAAAVFAVSARSGRLIEWKLLRFEASNSDRAEKLLKASIRPYARGLAASLKDAMKAEMSELPPAEIEDAPDPASPAAKNFRGPIPYRRLKPLYTNDAYLYDVEATVDIIIDLNAAGAILRTEIVRWAGYGLDESVETAVRSMNWRPAERNGRPLPMRFFVRYNFKKIEHQ